MDNSFEKMIEITEEIMDAILLKLDNDHSYINKINLKIKKTLLEYLFKKQQHDGTHITIEKYLNYLIIKESSIKENELRKIVKKCHGRWSNSYYIKEYKETILIYSIFDDRLSAINRKFTYAIEAIYTKEGFRKKDGNKYSQARILLESLSFYGDLYFDTYTDELISLLKNMKARKEEVFYGKESSQYILEINDKISKHLRLG